MAQNMADDRSESSGVAALPVTRVFFFFECYKFPIGMSKLEMLNCDVTDSEKGQRKGFTTRWLALRNCNESYAA